MKVKRCPITYEIIPESKSYSERGLKLLSPRLQTLKPIPFTALGLRQEALKRADKMSIQGVQSKLSARLNVVNGAFEVVDTGGTFIIKPQHELYDQAPENEDLTMRCAKVVGIDVPLHGLVYAEDGSLNYFIKRFDRYGKNKKYALEDFAQLAQKNRETKYNFSMEKLIPIIEEFTTFPVIEKTKLLLRVLVNFLLGNEDMHLKNFSLISIGHKVTLSPAYDFINSTIALPKAKEELALALNGRKRNLRRKDFVDYYGKEKLQLNDKIIDEQLAMIQSALPIWHELIEHSFLNETLRTAYQDILETRRGILFP